MPGTGSFIQACASDYAGFAGSNPALTICDELGGFVHEKSRRLFDDAELAVILRFRRRLPQAGLAGGRADDVKLRYLVLYST